MRCTMLCDDLTGDTGSWLSWNDLSCNGDGWPVIAGNGGNGRDNISCWKEINIMQRRGYWHNATVKVTQSHIHRYISVVTIARYVNTLAFNEMPKRNTFCDGLAVLPFLRPLRVLWETGRSSEVSMSLSKLSSLTPVVYLMGILQSNITTVVSTPAWNIIAFIMTCVITCVKQTTTFMYFIGNRNSYTFLISPYVYRIHLLLASRNPCRYLHYTFVMPRRRCLQKW